MLDAIENNVLERGMTTQEDLDVIFGELCIQKNEVVNGKRIFWGLQNVEKLFYGIKYIKTT